VKHPGGRSKYKGPAQSGTCGAITIAGTPCETPVAGQRKWCVKHPGGRSRYKPAESKQLPRPDSRSARPRNTATAPGSTAATRRQDRISRRAVKAAPLVDSAWSASVLSQLRLITSSDIENNLSTADCAALARTASLMLQGHQARQRQSSWGGLYEFFGGPDIFEALGASIADGLELPVDDANIAAARALQAAGVALCRAAGVPLTDCPCFADPAGSELENVLFLLLRLALGDWTGLIIPLGPLQSP
jgi:hypothetical protein